MSHADEPLVEQLPLSPNGAFPNNPRCPVMIYRRAFAPAPAGALAHRIEQTFAAHGWSGGWRDGVYDYHHFHSTAHEALGCYAGRAQVQVGGEGAPIIELATGDVLVLPAGTAHRCVGASQDFRVVGSYAGGRSYDMRRRGSGEEAALALAIASVPAPSADPVHGAEGPLVQAWRAAG